MASGETSPDHRSPSEVRRAGNRLQDEPSVYLRQHARNPVDWYPWGDEALARARDLDRPIFLSSGYSSCHWCHVMEHEVFERDDIADLLNRRFVCIKVDREERPDIDGTYMQAVLLLTGRGGWPLSVFLTPDLQPFFGGTYFPPEQFVPLLRRIVDVWGERRADLTAQAAALAGQMLAAPPPAEAGAEVPGDAVLEAAVRQADAGFDQEHGGTDAAMKFPTPVRWQFLLHRWRKTGDETACALVVRTLDAMARGGIRDHVGGGFHRYTVDRDWTVPHFEKMLYDNAQLASLYLEAGAALGRDDLVQVGADVLDFLLREMRTAGGGFAGSFDADSGGEEGTYYVWTPAEIAAAVGESDAAAVCDLLGVTGTGNFEGAASVLTRRADPELLKRRHGLDSAAAAVLFERCRPALREARARRTPPGRDSKVVTAWNGLALSALARGAAVTGREEYRAAAAETAAFLRAHHRDPDGTLRRATTAGRPAGAAVLDDHAFLAAGLVDVYQVTGDVEHLAWARELVDRVRQDFARPEGGFFETAAATAGPLGRRFDPHDSVEPSGSAVMVANLLRLGALTGDADLGREGRRHLARLSDLIARAPLDLAAWLDAAQLLLDPVREVVIAADAGDAAGHALVRAVLETWPPGAVLSRIPAAGPDKRSLALAPVLLGKSAGEGAPRAWVCREGTCEAPTDDPAVLADQVRGDWYR